MADSAPKTETPATHTSVSGSGHEFAPATEDTVAERLPEDIQEINRRGYLRDSFFDFDFHAVRPDQREVLARDAAWLEGWETVKVRIESHCDERGAARYNLPLGEKRAGEDLEYLKSPGIDPSRIEMVSHTKERPFESGHDEGAWTQNRRDHLLVVAR
ncbi:MAG: OmpA family protein [Thermoanaerobaculia bacterium]